MVSDARDLYYNQRGGAPGVPAPTAQNLEAIRAAIAASQRAAAERAAAQQREWEAQRYSNIAANQRAPQAANYGTGAINNLPGYQSWQAYQQEQSAIAWRNGIAQAMAQEDARRAAQRRILDTNVRSLLYEHQNATRDAAKINLNQAMNQTAQRRALEGQVMMLTRVSSSDLWATQPGALGSSPDVWFARELGKRAGQMGLQDDIQWFSETGEYRFWMPDASLTAPDGTPYPERDEDIEGLGDANQGNKTGGFIEGSVFPNSRMNVADKYAQWATVDDAKKAYEDMPAYVKALAQDAAYAKFGPDPKPDSDKVIWNQSVDITLKWNKDGEDIPRSVTDTLTMTAEGFDPETTSLSDYLQAKVAGAQGEGFIEQPGWSGSRSTSDVSYSGRSYSTGGYGGYDSYGGGGGSYGGGGGGGGESASQSMVELSDRGTAQKLLNNASYMLMGRAATDAEVDAFLVALNAKEQANPTVVTATMDEAGGTSTTKQEGFSMESRAELAAEAIRSSPEAGAEQMGSTFANMLWNAVTQATAGESSTNQGVF